MCTYVCMAASHYGIICHAVHYNSYYDVCFHCLVEFGHSAVQELLEGTGSPGGQEQGHDSPVWGSPSWPLNPVQGHPGEAEKDLHLPLQCREDAVCGGASKSKAEKLWAHTVYTELVCTCVCAVTVLLSHKILTLCTEAALLGSGKFETDPPILEMGWIFIWLYL